MTDELRFPDPSERRIPRDSDALDERTTRMIREAYLPPVARGDSEAAYWDMLESRVMARVSSSVPLETSQGWLSVLNGWSQIGLVAAAALFAIGGVVSQHLGEPDEQVASDSFVQLATPEAISAPAQLIMSSDKSTQRDAALNYVLSY
jgi:hypothetical protein